ncbi:DUF6325 family protein [Leifsonia sp. AG29]|uniref:DUF6325 family protein n=1 Tax=Leifsonia sp. AG29 TaxID=2598860 RepID=UPI001E3ED22E|nr:DUF6325 family protein [Leifsonia sp. AG29]
MAEFEYGPAEFMVAQFDTDRPSPGVVQSIIDLIDSGTLRLLDLLFVERHEDGTVDVIELDQIGDEIGMVDVTLEASGLAGDEDVDQMAQLLEPGSTGAIFVFEHLWAKELAARFFESGGVVLHSERIPAPVVNAIAAEALADELEEVLEESEGGAEDAGGDAEAAGDRTGAAPESAAASDKTAPAPSAPAEQK